MGGKQGRKKRNWLPLQLAAAMPLATLALAALAARLILGGKLPESSLPVAAGVIAGLVAFLGALIAALHSGRRKLLCGLGAAGGYALFLLLDHMNGGHKSVTRIKLEVQLMRRESCRDVSETEECEYYI